MTIREPSLSVVNSRAVSCGAPISSGEKRGGSGAAGLERLLVRWRRTLPELVREERDRLERCLGDMSDVCNGLTDLGSTLDRWAFFVQSARGADRLTLRQCAADVLELWTSGGQELRETLGAARSEPPAAAAFAADPFDLE
jgi:hypothetical protein